ncbi:hypothetical protein MFIFM68171_05678 [Madurella fahalii]|uniref:Uncharacterized protein n=1 Tax=Madurella fahalii TaxID=1157608 RepID=A0ABQ0GCH1_9PEZI
MKGIFARLGVFLTLTHLSFANLDVVSLYTKRDTWIQEVVATLIVGDVPNPITGDVALWTGIMTDKRDFLQGVTQNSPQSYYCANLGRNWCTFAYNLIGSRTPENGTPAIAPPGSRIKTHYKINSETQLWDQKVYINDKLVSQISTSRGYRGTIFYVSMECASGRCAPAPAHSWEEMSIVLSKADQSFGRATAWLYKAAGGEMSTPDGGKTWNFTTLIIPETAFP